MNQATWPNSASGSYSVSA